MTLSSKLKSGIGVALLVATFLGGVRVEHWRLTAKYDAAESKRETAVRDAMVAAAAHTNELNQATEIREHDLLGVLSKNDQTVTELRNELEQRPVIRQVVEKPVVVNGALECPAVPTMDWGLFRTLYNRAATGDPEAGPASGGDAAVRGVTADLARGP